MSARVLQDVDPTKWKEHLYNLPPERWTSLQGKSFWITGAGTGYGRAIACGLAAAGCQVFLTGRRRNKLQETIEEISSMQIGTDNCHIVEADITNYDEMVRACDKVTSLCGGLHGLVNNAAISSRLGSPYPLQQDPLEYWNKTIATNVTAPWLIMRTIFPHMCASGQVRVLFITSGAGWASTPGFGIYNISKSALNSLCASLAQEYGQRYRGGDIQINGLNPGEAKTEMNQGSTVSPYSVVSMVLILLSHPPGGPNGKFFYRDGQSLPFGDSEPYCQPLIDPPTRTEKQSDAGNNSGKGGHVKTQKEFSLDPSPPPQTMGLGQTSPVLVKEGYKGFNIILYNSEIHALSQATGSIDLSEVSLGQFYEFRRRGQWIVAGSAQEVMEKIERQVTLRETSCRPVPSRYPIEIPPIDFLPKQDFILLELPPRYMPMMPNGVGYVHNILKKMGIPFQTLDLNIVFYHLYHAMRILGGNEKIILPSGSPMPEDPWQITDIDKWNDPEVLQYFEPQIQDVIDGLVEAKPKIVGLSLNGLNLKIAREVVKGLRRGLPEALVLVGGHSCVYPDVGPRHFPDFDYMCIGEADLTLEPLVKSLLAGERPKDLPGILSRYDSPGRVWEPAPLLEDLDAVDYPTYEWTDIRVYRTFDGNQLIPITASRGCCWSRCHFCSERFPWRRRSPKKVVEEIEWFANRGGRVFHFNESDVNGDPDALLAICDEIVKRKLKVSLTGQLRIDKRSNRDFFNRLRAGGFVALRFGVDGWSINTLRLQKKGYPLSLVEQNLRDCYESGIRVAVNIVIGVPGETDEDIQESINNMLHNKNHFHLLENIHTLILSHGSEYYEHPEHHHIRFRGDKKELYERFPDMIPPHLWYSLDPYIDHEVRLNRMRMIANCITP